MDGPQYGKVPLGRVRWSVFGGACVRRLAFCRDVVSLSGAPFRCALALVSVSDFSERAAFVRDVL